MTSWLDRAVMAVSPSAGLSRIRARRMGEALMNYEIANIDRRSKGRRPTAADADTASARRQRAAFVARDLVRNGPTAARAVSVISGAVVGDGIIPSVAGASEEGRRRFEAAMRAQFDTPAIDAEGVLNLYGLQRVAANAMVTDGEVLIRIRRRRAREDLAFPFQLQMLEADYLDTSRDLQGTGAGVNEIRNGIEVDARGRRVAYHLFDEHPGGTRTTASVRSRRVPASEVIHLFRPERPGQTRGVSWFAPVASKMQDLDDYLEAQLVRNKIAACFTAFRIQGDDAPTEENDPLRVLSPGLVHTLGPGEDVKFAEPPAVSGLDEFARVVLRQIAAGLGVTYEALTGDLSGVNFASGRMGRLDMDRNVSSWQWLMMVPQMCQPIGDMALRSMQFAGVPGLENARVVWTPPARPIVDPTKEFNAQRTAVRSGFRSWQSVVRSLGEDPDEVAREIAEDAARFDALGVTVESDARQSPGAGDGSGDGGAAGGQQAASGAAAGDDD